MNSKERKDREKEQLQNKIFDAAVEIILTEGLEKLSIRKIAANIAYSPSTIYNYFENKNDILDSIAFSVYLEVVNEVRNVLAENSRATSREKIRLCSMAFIKTMTKYPEKFRAVMLVSNRSTEDLKTEPDHEGKAILEELILSGKEQGDFNHSQEDSAELFLVALMGFVYHVVSTNRPIADSSTEKMAETYIEMLIHGLD
ncbi:TetR/AcrR family transcriptional regulator [Enterococcus rivorum]|uniref:HTH tetR-type domain-containing protein n=1 Tax=Enterococcus rivorum TaxID=762845 RepID=A0A1E5KVN2_9ENTE|nr:TetR/AcrR family transcriptional regulator [Enterococcus rivorum]MBP2098283.1 AcrR family transcriptional regulator [Enterococcus rivorum]OEH81921.1 hypothetical protein BCR26_03990 [Enterococcus rivorum]